MHKPFTAIHKSWQSLRDIKETHMTIKKSSARKYIENYWLYVAEKMHAIEHAELSPNSQCLDISTGLGLLPFMLENMGHTCDATDVSSHEEDLDPDVTKHGQNHQDAFSIMRTVHHTFIDHLNVKPKEYITLPKKYDCIFSMRIVWDSQFSFNDGSYEFFINNMLDFSDKLVLSWNMDSEDDIPPCIKPFVVEEQFDYGTLTIHTEKI